jgi:hypothetical protein
VAKPATGNSNVRVWYQTNNYSNIRFTTLMTNSGYTANDNVYIEFYSSATDLANGIYMIKNVYNGNTYNIFYDANISIANSTTTYGSLVFIPNTTNEVTGTVVRHTNTINSITHSGLGIVSGSVMEGISYVSLYK